MAVHTCGLNHCDLDSRAGTSRWTFAFPMVLGGEFAGYIYELGEGVTGWEVGQPVTALQQYSCGSCDRCRAWRPDRCRSFVVFGTDRWGGYAQRVSVPAHTLIALRGAEDFMTAAAAQCVVSTAWHMVMSMARPRYGETVLVPSAGGGVASALVQCARMAGARVIATVGDGAKAEGVRKLGADVVLNYRQDDVVAAVHDLTGGEGVDYVLDTVGGPLFGTHLEALRVDGQLITCGGHAGEVVDLDIIPLFRRGHSLRGFRLATPDEIRHSLQLALDGRIRVPVHQTFPLTETAAAHEALDRRQHVGKIVLVNE
jgi:NADPH:quinone reductase-like Zn-dependent oxidoreductase